MNICNGCGEESLEFGKLCSSCSLEVICTNCHNHYLKGQGLHDVLLCPSCLQKVWEEETLEDDIIAEGGNMIDPHEEYGFDHSWEL